MHVSILGWNIFLGIVSQKGKWVGGGLERLHYLTTFMFLFDTSRGGQLCFSQLCLLAHGTVLEINLSNTVKLSRNVTCVRYIILSDWMKFQMSSSFFFFFIFYHLYPICTWTIIGIHWSFKIFHFILWSWNPRWPYSQTFWSFKHWH